MCNNKYIRAESCRVLLPCVMLTSSIGRSLFDFNEASQHISTAPGNKDCSFRGASPLICCLSTDWTRGSWSCVSGQVRVWGRGKRLLTKLLPAVSASNGRQLGALSIYILFPCFPSNTSVVSLCSHLSFPFLSYRAVFSSSLCYFRTSSTK